jgi:hypothetical protein
MMDGAQPKEIADMDKVEITPEMIEAAAEVLWRDPLLDITTGQAETLAAEMLRRAMGVPRHETSATPVAEPSMRDSGSANL